MTTFLCWDRDNCEFDDAEEVEAFDAEDAARSYAESYDQQSGDGWREESAVWVVEKGQPESTKQLFAIEVELDPTYSASEAHEHTCSTCKMVEVCGCRKPDESHECDDCRIRRRFRECDAAQKGGAK